MYNVHSFQWFTVDYLLVKHLTNIEINGYKQYYCMYCTVYTFVCTGIQMGTMQWKVKLQNYYNYCIV